MKIKFTNKIFLIVASILFFFFIALTDCKKDSNTTRNDKLIGKWKQIQYALDDNNNGVMDPQEINNVNKNVIDEMLFNKDSTGLENVNYNGIANSYPFTWYFIVGDTFQRNGIGHDTLRYAMVNVSSKNLTLMTQTNFGLAWYIYERK